MSKVSCQQNILLPSSVRIYLPKNTDVVRKFLQIQLKYYFRPIHLFKVIYFDMMLLLLLKDSSPYFQNLKALYCR